MEKLTQKAVKLIAQDNGETFGVLLSDCLLRIAGNSGWAGLLPAAVAEKAIETAISFSNKIAELNEELNDQKN